MQETVYFAHANGFPGACYQQMFNYLMDDFNVEYVDSLGHQAEYPITQNWEHLVWELIYHIEKHHAVPIIGVGHSLGGILTYLAGVHKPELFKAIVMLDTPILGPWKSYFVSLLKKMNLIDNITPGKRTKQRRQHWPSAAHAFDYFKSKTLFQNFTDSCLRDYVTYGMEQIPEGLQLRFRREVEYQIYRTLPHNLPKYSDKLLIPAGVLYGANSNVIKAADVRYLNQRLQLPCQVVSGGHLFPFEYPEESAKMLKKMIEQLLICYA